MTKPDALHIRDTLIGLTLAAAITGSWLVLHIWSIFLAEWSRYPWLVPLVVAVQCWLSVGLFIIAHDAMHGSLAPGQPRLNAWVGQLCLGLYAGFSYRKLHKEHHAHHAHSGTAQDPDFDARHPTRFWPWYARFLRYYFGWREFLVLSVIVAAYLLILRERFPLVLLFWALPALLSSLQLFAFGTYFPHRHDTVAFQDHHNARSSSLSSLPSLLTCFHFGYHHEHHLKPHLSWWKLPGYKRQLSRGHVAETRSGDVR